MESYVVVAVSLGIIATRLKAEFWLVLKSCVLVFAGGSPLHTREGGRGGGREGGEEEDEGREGRRAHILFFLV